MQSLSSQQLPFAFCFGAVNSMCLLHRLLPYETSRRITRLIEDLLSDVLFLFIAENLQLIVKLPKPPVFILPVFLRFWWCPWHLRVN